MIKIIACALSIIAVACASQPKPSTVPAASAVDARTVDADKHLEPTTQGFIEANGTRIWHEIYGTGDPVVMLHGGFMTNREMQGLIQPRLAVIPGYSHYNFMTSKEIAPLIGKFLADPMTGTTTGLAEVMGDAPTQKTP